MRLWRRLIRKRLQDVTDELPATNADAAAEAVVKSQQKRQEVEQQWDRVNAVSSRLASHRKRNHFGELINESMRRSH